MHGDALDDAGVVDEDVDLAYFLVDRLDKGLDGHFVGHVAHVAVDVLDACFLVVVQTALEGSLVDVVENDVLDAGCDECLRNVEADAVRRTCNPGVLTFE